MAFCTNCGAQVADGTAFCPTCGKAVAGGQPAAAAPPPPPAAGYAPAPTTPAGAAQSPTAGLQENVAGLLCYVLGWITGLIFLFIDKRPFVRFHAAQSVVVFGSLTIIYIILGQFFVATVFSGGWTFFMLIFTLFRLAMLVLWILLMVKAYQGQRYKLPVAGDFAESLAGKVNA